MSVTKIRTSAQITVDQNLDINTKKIVNMAAGTTAGDAVEYAQLNAAILAAIGANDVMIYKGVIDCSTNPNYPLTGGGVTGYGSGWTYKVSVAGRIGGASGLVVVANDLIICKVDNSPTGDQATVGANWDVIYVAAVDGAVSSSSTPVTDNTIVRFDSTTGTVIQAGYTGAGVVIPTISDLGEITAKSYNGLNITTTTGSLTISNGKTLTVSDNTTLAVNSISFAGSETLTLTAAKNVSFADAFSTSGAFAMILTSTASTNVTLPTTGTLATLTGTEVFTNKTLTTPWIHDTSSDQHYKFTVSELTADRNIHLPLLTNDDEFVFKEFTQILTNKTLTLPKITSTAIYNYNFAVNTLTADRTITLPLLTGNDVFVFADFTQILTNKTLTLPKITSTGSYNYNFAVNTLTADRTITLPLLTGNDIFVFADFTQTLTNKKLVLSAGSITVAPIVFTSGTSLTTPVAGALEFTTDTLSFTITTGTARKTIAFAENINIRNVIGAVPTVKAGAGNEKIYELNTTSTGACIVATASVYWGGIRQKLTDDYSIVQTSATLTTITFENTPITGDKILVDYWY